MAGNNGSGQVVREERLAAVRHRPVAVASPQQLALKEFAAQVGREVQLAVGDQLRQEVLPRLEALEERVEGLTTQQHHAIVVQPPRQALVPVDHQDLQRRARDRVD